MVILHQYFWWFFVGNYEVAKHNFEPRNNLIIVFYRGYHWIRDLKVLLCF